MNQLVAIVGPTGIGKSRLALYLAHTFDGEIVNADSRQIYHHMDIGTAKPTPEELSLVPHHLVNIVNPDENFSQAHYQQLAYKAISDIQQRDDYLYRTIFELDPIPPSVREAGFGGTNRYVDFEGYDNSDVMIGTFKKVDVISKKLYVQSKSFDTVIKLAKNKEKMIAAIPAIQPVALKDFNRISDYFGARSDPFTGKRTMHNGMDFTGPEGSDIFATGDGVVIESGYSFYGYGNKVVIDHGYGYKTVYAHLQKITVDDGQKVKRGEVIGLLGNTGRSTGAHLHYEVKLNNRPKDPINYYFNDMTDEEYDLMVEACSKRRTPMD